MSSRTFPATVRIKGYVRRWHRRAPPPRKLSAWDAGALSAHVTCGNAARDTFPAAQNGNSVLGREGGFDTDRYFFPPDPYQGHAKGQELTTRDPQARQLMPANTGVLRRAQPAAPDGMPRQKSTSQATLTSVHRTAAPTRQPQNPQDMAQYGTRQAGKHDQKHRTIEPEQCPGFPKGSTGMHQGGTKGPCHRRGCTYDWPKGTAKHQMMGCACNAASRTSQGMSYRIWKPSSAVVPIVATFLALRTRPTIGGAAHSQKVPCWPNATGTLPTNTETGMTTTRTRSDRASARCSAKEPTPNKPIMRQLQQPCTKKTAEAATT